jgi:hypothetical protein
MPHSDNPVYQELATQNARSLPVSDLVANPSRSARSKVELPSLPQLSGTHKKLVHVTSSARLCHRPCLLKPTAATILVRPIAATIPSKIAMPVITPPITRTIGHKLCSEGTVASMIGIAIRTPIYIASAPRNGAPVNDNTASAAKKSVTSVTSTLFPELSHHASWTAPHTNSRSQVITKKTCSPANPASPTPAGMSNDLCKVIAKMSLRVRQAVRTLFAISWNCIVQRRPFHRGMRTAGEGAAGDA